MVFEMPLGFEIEYKGVTISHLDFTAVPSRWHEVVTTYFANYRVSFPSSDKSIQIPNA